MGLYIDKQNRSIYRSKSKPKAKNQRIYFSDYKGQMIQEQKKLNHTLTEAHVSLKDHYLRQEKKQTRRWKDINHQLDELRLMNVQQEKQKDQFFQHINELETMSKKIQANQGSIEKVEDELKRLSNFQQKIAEKLEGYDERNKALLEKLQQHFDIHEQVVEKMNSLVEREQQMEKRIDNQEALTEKVIRQLEYIRSVIFERTDYLAERIDIFSNYLHQFIPTSNRLMMPKKKTTEEKSK